MFPGSRGTAGGAPRGRVGGRGLSGQDGVGTRGCRRERSTELDGMDGGRACCWPAREGPWPSVTIFGRTVTPFASSQISRMSTNFFMLGKLDLLCLPAVESRVTRSESPALALWGRPRARGHRSALRAGRTEKPVCCQGRGQQAGDGECASVPSVLRGRGVSPVQPQGGHHTGPLGEAPLLTGPMGRSLMPLPLRSWPRPPPRRLHGTPPTSPMAVLQASVPRSGFVPPSPHPSLDSSSPPTLPSPPAPAPPILPSAQGVPCLHAEGQSHSGPVALWAPPVHWPPPLSPVAATPETRPPGPPVRAPRSARPPGHPFAVCVPALTSYLPLPASPQRKGRDRNGCVFVSPQIHPSEPQRDGVTSWGLGRCVRLAGCS